MTDQEIIKTYKAEVAAVHADPSQAEAYKVNFLYVIDLLSISLYISYFTFCSCFSINPKERLLERLRDEKAASLQMVQL